MDTRLITDSFLCPDSNWLLERTVLVIATVCVSNDCKRYQTPYVKDTSDQCAVYIAPAAALNRWPTPVERLNKRMVGGWVGWGVVH